MFLRQVSYARCWIWTFPHSMFQNTFFRRTLLSGPRDNTLDTGLGSEVKFFALGQGWVSQLHWMCSSFSWENSDYLAIMIYTENTVTTTGNVCLSLLLLLLLIEPLVDSWWREIWSWTQALYRFSKSRVFAERRFFRIWREKIITSSNMCGDIWRRHSYQAEAMMKLVENFFRKF